MEDLLELAASAAHRGGQALRSRFERDLSLETKSSAIDLVTEADRVAERVVLEHIRAACPDHAILSEEAGEVAVGGELTWIIDPLDGTTNFAHGFPHFSVSIALYRGKTGEIGVVHDPLRHETFVARRGAGACLRSRRCGHRRLEVTNTAELGRSLVATGFHYGRATAKDDNVDEFCRVIRRVRGIRRAGSAALDLAYVAAGRLDGYWEYHLSPWDTAAGAVLVREAGGVVCGLDGSSWDPWCPAVAAAGPGMLPVLLEAVRG